jgi:hypothetical protein
MENATEQEKKQKQRIDRRTIAINWPSRVYYFYYSFELSSTVFRIELDEERRTVDFLRQSQNRS